MNEVKKALGVSTVRLFNSDGAEYYEEDLKYIKNKAVLYATRGEDFDSSSCLSEYEIGTKLGEGGFGNVFLASHIQTGQKYAIKIIKTENIGSASDIDNIFVEAEIMKSLNHENIVKVVNCFTLRSMEVAIIMEFLEGGELLKLVEKEGRIDEKTTQNIIGQIVKGMRYCHQNNLIHRDLKLENILLVNSEEKKIKIIDFGIAGAISFLTQEDLDTGSLGYMAP
jgi:serine/threonine protein kinase